ncbi:MAG: tetratricopeptide repeat protein [bacterium]
MLTTLDAPVAGVAFSADGGRVVAWAPPRTEVIDVATGGLVGAATWPGLDAARLSPAGDLLYLIHENGQIRSVKVEGSRRWRRWRRGPRGQSRSTGSGLPGIRRHSHVVVHAAGALALTDPRVGWEGGQPGPARGLVGSPTGFWRAHALPGGTVTLERLDPTGGVVETVTLPAPRVRAACGICPDASPPAPDATDESLRGDDVVGVTVSADGAEIALVTGGDFNSYQEDGSVGCGASVCVLRRGQGDRLTRDARRSVRWRDVVVGDPVPGFATLALHRDGVRGCVAAFGHGARALSGEGFIDGLSLRRDKSDRGRCRLLMTPTEVTVGITGADGAVWLHGGQGRRLAGPTFISAMAVHGQLLATGHVDGGVRLWSRAPRPAVGTGWQATARELPEEPPDAQLAGPKEGGGPGWLGTWRSVDGGLALDAPQAVTLPLDPGVRPQDDENMGISPDGRLARVRLGPLGYEVWPLEAPGQGLRLPPFPCALDPAISPEDAWRFDPERPYLLKLCDDGVFEAPATWAAVKARLASAVRGCLSARQRVELLGEREDEARAAVVACRAQPRPLPRVVTPAPADSPPDETPVDGDPLPPIGEIAPDADRGRDAQALNVQGLRALGRGDRVGAAELFEAAVRLDPAYHLARYNLACMYALLGRDEDALDILAAFEAAGCEDCRARVARAGTDPDWASLRDNPRFVRLTRRAAP